MSFRSSLSGRRASSLSRPHQGLSQYKKTPVVAPPPPVDTEVEDDYDGYGSEEEERMLSRKHGEARDADDAKDNAEKSTGPPPSKRQKTDEEIAAEYNHGKTKAKPRKPRVTLNEEVLLQPNGLTAIYAHFPDRFHKMKYKRNPKGMARFSRHLRSAYQQWAQELVPGMPLQEVIWKIETMNSKTSVKNFLQGMRNQIRNQKVERIYGLETAERLLAQLDEGMVEDTTISYPEEHAQESKDVQGVNGNKADDVPAENPPEDEFEDMDAIMQEAAFGTDPDDFVPTEYVAGNGHSNKNNSNTTSKCGIAASDIDKKDTGDDIESAMQEAAFDMDPDDFVPTGSLTPANTSKNDFGTANSITPIITAGFASQSKPDRRRILDDNDDSSSDEGELEFEVGDVKPAMMTKAPSSTPAVARRAVLEDSDDDEDETELEICNDKNGPGEMDKTLEEETTFSKGLAENAEDCRSLEESNVFRSGVQSLFNSMDDNGDEEKEASKVVTEYKERTGERDEAPSKAPFDESSDDEEFETQFSNNASSATQVSEAPTVAANGLKTQPESLALTQSSTVDSEAPTVLASQLQTQETMTQPSAEEMESTKEASTGNMDGRKSMQEESAVRPLSTSEAPQPQESPSQPLT